MQSMHAKLSFSVAYQCTSVRVKYFYIHRCICVRRTLVVKLVAIRCKYGGSHDCICEHERPRVRLMRTFTSRAVKELGLHVEISGLPSSHKCPSKAWIKAWLLNLLMAHRTIMI